MKEEAITKQAKRFIRIKKIELAMKTCGLSVADFSSKDKIGLCSAYGISSVTLNNDLKIIEKISQLAD